MSGAVSLRYEQFGDGGRETAPDLQVRIDQANATFIEEVEREISNLKEAVGHWPRNAQGWVTVTNIFLIAARRLASFHPSGQSRILVAMPSAWRVILLTAMSLGKGGS